MMPMHACPLCGVATARRGRCTTCARATNQRKRDRPTARTVYSTRRWRELRQHILKRDDYTCQVCGEHGTVAGHIHPFTDHRDPLAWDPRNLRCECLRCGGREAGKRSTQENQRHAHA
jgi:5-methylcytosine-specific restriction endonuclease McrA